jgi:hypothetical protein
MLATPAVADDAANLKKAVGEEGIHPAWIYNDLDQGFALARKTKKPLLVVLRCVT